MKPMILLSGIVLLLVVMVGVAGWLLPATRVASASKVIAAKPAKVWQVLTDVGAQPAWRPQIAAVDVIDATPGKERWVERPRRGPELRFETEKCVEPTEWVIRFSGPAEGRWTGRLEGVEGDQHTRIHVEEVFTVGNPWKRVMARFFFDPQAFVESHLSELKAQAEKAGN